MAELTTTLDLTPDGAVVHAAGDLDGASSPALDATLHGLVDAGHRHLVLDLAEVTFIGSTALASIVDAHRVFVAAGGSVVLRHPPPVARRVLDAAGVSEVVKIED